MLFSGTQVRQHLNKLRERSHRTNRTVTGAFAFMFTNNWYEFIGSGEEQMKLASDLTWCLQQLYVGNVNDPSEIRHFANAIKQYGKLNIMAKGKANEQHPPSPGSNKFNWVTITLTGDDEREIAALNWTPDEILDNIAELVLDGYSVSTKFDAYSGSVACHITCNKPQHPDNGHGVTGYSDYLTDAVVVALYKLLVKAKGALSTYKAEKGRYR
jgi:hypothetical protein